MRRKEAQVAHLNPYALGREDLSRSAVTGRISAVDDEGIVTVWISGQGPRQARLAIPATLERIREAIEQQQAVLLLIDEAAPERPIIVGFVEDRVRPADTQVIEADVDGKRVRIEGKDEVVLECGSASITLRRNGRVVIKGAYVETHSDGTNRIKGGQVRIN
jgi:hypothetical protein